MRRETEVPDERVPVVECLDGPARITLKELAPFHCVKGGTLQSACSAGPRVVVGLGKSAHSHTVRLMNSRQKGSKKNDDKSAVAMLKKNDLHESVWQLVVNRDESHVRSGRHDFFRGTCHELKRGPVRRRSSSARQLGCVLSYGRAQTCRNQIQRVKFTKAIARHTKNSRPKSLARIYLPR